MKSFTAWRDVTDRVLTTVLRGNRHRVLGESPGWRPSDTVERWRKAGSSETPPGALLLLTEMETGAPLNLPEYDNLSVKLGLGMPL